MTKKYRLLIDSPTHEKGMIATQQKDGDYEARNPSNPNDTVYFFPSYIIENRPEVWQLIEEPKQSFKRWRGSLYEKYYVMGHNRSSTSRTELDAHENSKNHANGDYFHCKKVSDRAITRVEIMCRLMGLAETIEEGSTEMNGDWTMGYYSVNNMEIIPVYSKSTSAYLNTSKLASFSTKELAQLFLDSAGQDAIDWYGAVK